MTSVDRSDRLTNMDVLEIRNKHNDEVIKQNDRMTTCIVVRRAMWVDVRCLLFPFCRESLFRREFDRS